MHALLTLSIHFANLWFQCNGVVGRSHRRILRRTCQLFDFAYDHKVSLRTLVVCLILLLSPLPAAFAQAAATGSGGVSGKQVQLAVGRLQRWYNPETGLWNSTGWWNSANALTALIDYERVSGDRQYLGVIAQTYAANVHRGFLNNYYDDEGWWALAWIEAYDLTGDRRYLATATAIFEDMRGGWDSACGGGIWWSKKRTYKNAIANELFLSVAAHLANEIGGTQREQFAAWAQREWKWFRKSGMIERDHLISDGLTAACKDNHQTKWSYNQGVVLGGLVELSRQGHGRRLLREANAIAGAAVRKLSDEDGILHDTCEPKCGADGTQFKGIFMRNLAALNQRQPEKLYRQFILANAESILKNDQGLDHGFGVVWSGPPDGANASTQSSALDALIAALEVETEKDK